MSPRLPTHDSTAQLQEEGLVLLRGILSAEPLVRFKEAADQCFDALDRATPPPEDYRFNPISNSLLLTALLDFGLNDSVELLLPLSSPELETQFIAAIGSPWTCSLAQSWLRRKFPSTQSPTRAYHNQDWHQDGALGVRFPARPGPHIPMTQLLTCWIPLEACGVDRPGLEFIRRPQPSLLHFTELDDATLRRRFRPDQFWSPALEPGDVLLFLNSVLHRTHATPAMRSSRTSIEYRIFPSAAKETRAPE
jgi:ectoine hydroxylase-related dioxygenase (phytanoyl-CoA dioxygenase family)